MLIEDPVIFLHQMVAFKAPPGTASRAAVSDLGGYRLPKLRTVFFDLESVILSKIASFRLITKTPEEPVKPLK